MSLFVKPPKDRFEKLFFNIYYTVYKSRVVICHERNRSCFDANNLPKFEIVDFKIQNCCIVIPVLFATSMIGVALLQSDVYSQFILSIVSLILLIISFSVKKILLTIVLDENKMNLNRYDVDVKFKNLEGISFYKIV